MTRFSKRFTIGGGPQTANRVREMSAGMVSLSFLSSTKPV